jgi:hypothetical protein
MAAITTGNKIVPLNSNNIFQSLKYPCVRINQGTEGASGLVKKIKSATRSVATQHLLYVRQVFLKGQSHQIFRVLFG